MGYQREINVEFSHCDPAGIVFFPRYLEMVNSVVENFFRDALHYPFAMIMIEDDFGIPTVHLDVTFRAPSRMGEVLRFNLDVVKVGRSSVDFVTRALCHDELRMECRQRIVWVGPDGRAQGWPDVLKTRLTGLLRNEE